MSDWRKAWFTYGGESDNAIVNPETGEAEYEITDIDGVLPDDLVGILYRNGPGKFGVNGERVAHILDADGLVLRFEFRPPSYAGNRVKFTSRFIETEGFIEEREKQQFTKRGTFGTAPTPDWYKLNRNGLNADPAEKPPLLTRVVANALNVDIKNTANTQVIAFGGKVLALWEAGMPYSLDPVTLQTIGIDSLGLNRDFRGKLSVNYVPGLPQELQPDILGGLAHTAHPKICPRTGHLVGWTWAQNPTDGSLEMTITEYNSDDFSIVASETHIMKDVALAPHDMVLTEHYVMLKINSLEMDQFAFLSGAKGPAECLGMDGRSPVKAFVFPRPTLSANEKEKYTPFMVEDIPACFSIHFSHGYEDEKTGNLVSYFSGWPPSDSETFLGAWGGFAPLYSNIPQTFYWRIEIDTETKKCVDLRVSPGHENMCVEHPVVHPVVQTKDATFAYAQCCNKIGDSSAPMGYAKMRLDGTAPVQLGLQMGDANEEVDVYWVGSRRFAGEPLVVPKQGSSGKETEAYLLGLV
jgi:all-trans-8'-apo-beta-carotenal 15,15'-oxygenase